ncbi:MAG: helix-turn-helix domain-containing protein [Lentimonas sp.]
MGFREISTNSTTAIVTSYLNPSDCLIYQTKPRFPGGASYSDRFSLTRPSKVSPLEFRFRKHLGRTMAEEILRVQIEQARLMLMRTNLSLEQTGNACGLASTAHFTRLFKKETFYTLGVYRNIDTQTH